MKVVNIIIVLLFILFIILNIYYIFHVRKIGLYKELQLEHFNFANSYNEENANEEDGSLFQQCNTYNCTNTYSELENNSADFINTYSIYENKYKLSNLRDTSHEYRRYNDIMTKKSLLAFRCLKSSPFEIKKHFENNLVGAKRIPTIYKKMFLYDEISLYTYITNQLEEIVNGISSIVLNSSLNKGTNKILGPVYICISQAPYIKYRDNMVKARFDVVNNQRSFYNENVHNGQSMYELETSNGQNNKISSLYTEVLFIFPMYNIKNTVNNVKNIEFSNDVSRMTAFMASLNKFFVHEKLCFLKCNKSHLSCGCLNANNQDMNGDDIHIENNVIDDSIHKYKSECYDHNSAVKNYSIMYYINPYGNINDEYILNINR